MTLHVLRKAITLMLLVSGLASCIVFTVAAPKDDESSLEAMDTFPHTDLTSMLRRAPFHEARIFEAAQKHIQEIESSPACHQLATSALIDSCQLFSSLPGQDSARPADGSLDEVRQQYAARLAVCELQGIKSGIPNECTPFMPSHQACPKINAGGFFRRIVSHHDQHKRVCYPDYTPRQLKQCIDTLFDQAQRWTSYSNAQTNAIVVCQASRGAVENEQHLRKLHESLKSQTRVSEALSRAVQETEDRLAQHYKFTAAINRFQKDIASRTAAALANADGMVAKLVAKFDLATQTLFDSLRDLIEDANDETRSLNNNIKAANDDVNQTRATLQELHAEAVSREEERSNLQDMALRDNQALASHVQSTLETVRDVTVHALAERLRGVETALVYHLQAQQKALEDQQAFQETQSRIVEHQTRIETSLISQHELIEEQSSKLAEMTFGGLGATVATYVGLAFFVLLISRASLLLAVAATSWIAVTATIDFPLLSQLSGMVTSTLKIIRPTALRLLCYLLGSITAGSLVYSTVVAVSMATRSLRIDRTAADTMPEVEIKREPTTFDV